MEIEVLIHDGQSYINQICVECNASLSHGQHYYPKRNYLEAGAKVQEVLVGDHN